MLRRFTSSSSLTRSPSSSLLPLALSFSNLRYKSSKSSSSSTKKKQQQLQQEKIEQEIKAARQVQLEEETRAFDLRVHQEEIAEFKQHELESTFEMIEGDIPLVSAKSTRKHDQGDAPVGGDEEDDDLQNDGAAEGPYIPSPAPDLLMVQLCDHMQHEQGVKRHAVTITFGADGFRLANMCKEVRRDLKKQLATSYWQMHQTQERSAFFVCTRISHGTADLLITSMTQRLISYVERFGYRMNSSYVTLSPDVQHTSVRMLYHYFIFRRTDESKLLEAQLRMEERQQQQQQQQQQQNVAGNEQGDENNENENGDVEDDDDDDDGDKEYLKGQPEFRNFEPPQVGPQEPSAPTKKLPKSQKVDKIWKD